MLSHTEGVVKTTSLEGLPVISVFSRVPDFGWSIGIGISFEPDGASLAGSAHHLQHWVGLLGPCAGVGTSHVTNITRPIHSLRALAAAVDQHGFQDALPTGLAETDDVAATLANAAHERHAAERAREEAFTLLRTIIETAPGLLYTKDRHGRMMLGKQRNPGADWQALD